MSQTSSCVIGRFAGACCAAAAQARRQSAVSSSRGCMRVPASGMPLAGADILQQPGLVGDEVLAEELPAALQRRPVRVGAYQRAEVGPRGLEHGAKVELVRF